MFAFLGICGQKFWGHQNLDFTTQSRQYLRKYKYTMKDAFDKMVGCWIGIICFFHFQAMAWFLGDLRSLVRFVSFWKKRVKSK